MATTKATNFTDAQTSKIKAEFSALTSATGQKDLVEKIAKEMGKNTRSIIAKASNLGVYKKAEKVTKTGAKIQTKAEIVLDIAKKFDLDESAIESLESATKQALHAILNIKKAE